MAQNQNCGSLDSCWEIPAPCLQPSNMCQIIAGKQAGRPGLSHEMYDIWQHCKGGRNRSLTIKPKFIFSLIPNVLPFAHLSFNRFS